MIKIKKEHLITIIFILFSTTILLLSIRGIAGNPTSIELNTSRWKENGPFELSPERGRYALLYSIIEDKSLRFSLPLARFVSPDLGMSKSGEYVSLFAPGVSFLLILGYIIGKYFGAAQVGSAAVISFFALLNIILIRSIAIRLGSNAIAAAIGAFTFIFATPAFTYAGTLYQHHISTFLILFGVYALVRWNNYWSLALVWFLAAFSVAVDNPNLFLMLPIAICALGRLVVFQNGASELNVRIKLLGLLSILAVALPVGFFLWFNMASNGNPFQLSGTLISGTVVDDNDEPIQFKVEQKLASENKVETKKEKNAVGFLNTRNLTNGFYIHFLSPDRGVINFAPVILIGILGFFFLYKRNEFYANLLIAIIGFNILLYSMWGDPYGGWAFGSRYFIPLYAILAIGLGIVLTQWRKNIIFLIIFFLFFNYSAMVNALGALTSSANPPQVEILALEKMTGKVEKYTYERNQQYLEENGLKSFVFRTYFSDKITAQNYYYLVYGLIVAMAASFLLFLKFSDFDFDKIFTIMKKNKYVHRFGFKIKR